MGSNITAKKKLFCFERKERASPKSHRIGKSRKLSQLKYKKTTATFSAVEQENKGKDKGKSVLKKQRAYLSTLINYTSKECLQLSFCFVMLTHKQIKTSFTAEDASFPFGCATIVIGSSKLPFQPYPNAI